MRGYWMPHKGEKKPAHQFLTKTFKFFITFISFLSIKVFKTILVSLETKYIILDKD